MYKVGVPIDSSSVKMGQVTLRRHRFNELSSRRLTVGFAPPGQHSNCFVRFGGTGTTPGSRRLGNLILSVNQACQVTNKAKGGKAPALPLTSTEYRILSGRNTKLAPCDRLVYFGLHTFFYIRRHDRQTDKAG